MVILNTDCFLANYKEMKLKLRLFLSKSEHFLIDFLIESDTGI